MIGTIGKYYDDYNTLIEQKEIIEHTFIKILICKFNVFSFLLFKVG